MLYILLKGYVIIFGNVERQTILQRKIVVRSLFCQRHRVNCHETW
jgi:hypothetical protein